MKTINLSKGKTAIVDDKDFENLISFKWYVTSNGYAVRKTWENKKQKCILMHREILGLSEEEKKDTDHINRNKLDNRRENLRIASRSQNMANVGLCKKNKSGFKGVHWQKRDKRWIAQCTANGKTIHLGSFLSIKEAVNIYNNAVKKYYGEFAFLNKI